MALEGTYGPDTLFGDFQHEPKSVQDIVKVGLNLSRGTVVARENLGAASNVADGGNTGNGTSSAVTLQEGAQEGDYVLTCILDGFSMPTTGTADGGNAGNGTMTGVDVDSLTIAGTYTFRCVDTTAGAGLRFTVEDPNGDGLEDAAGATPITYDTEHIDATLTEGGTPWSIGDIFTVLSTAVASGLTFSAVDPNAVALGNLTVGTPYAEEIGLTLTAGGTPFAVDDFWTVTVAAGSGQLIVALSTLFNGGQTLVGILANDTDASSAAKYTVVFIEGDFNETAMTFGGSDDADTWRAQGLQLGIHFSTNLEAA